MNRGRRNWSRDIRQNRRNSKRAAGDRRYCWPTTFACGRCGARFVRLYRSYGTFLRDDDIRCNEHVPGDGAWWVPCIQAADGSVWGYTSCPDADIARWKALPDAAPHAKTWDNGWIAAKAQVSAVENHFGFVPPTGGGR